MNQQSPQLQMMLLTPRCSLGGFYLFRTGVKNLFDEELHWVSWLSFQLKKRNPLVLYPEKLWQGYWHNPGINRIIFQVHCLKYLCKLQNKCVRLKYNTSKNNSQSQYNLDLANCNAILQVFTPRMTHPITDFHWYLWNWCLGSGLSYYY